MTNDDRFRLRTVDLISLMFTMGYFVILGLLMYRGIPDGNENSFNILLGILSAAMLGILHAYYNKDSSNSATATTLRTLSQEGAIATNGALKQEPHP